MEIVHVLLYINIEFIKSIELLIFMFLYELRVIQV